MSDLIHRAFLFALKAHEGQRRKYTNEPYIGHPVSVAFRLARLIDDEDVIAAALCHDTAEDCGATYQDIADALHGDVAMLVFEVTDISKPGDGSREYRKRMDRFHLSNASPKGKTIKLADLIDNTKSIVEHDPGFARTYLAEKRALLSALTDGHPVLFQEAIRLLIEGERKLEAV